MNVAMLRGVILNVPRLSVVAPFTKLIMKHKPGNLVIKHAHGFTNWEGFSEVCNKIENYYNRTRYFKYIKFITEDTKVKHTT